MGRKKVEWGQWSSLGLIWILHISRKRPRNLSLRPCLQKIKQELLLGLIALLLTTFQDRLGKICITEKQASQWLPCKKKDKNESMEDSIKRDYHPEEVLKKKVIPVHDHVFIRSHFLGFGRNSDFIGWLFAFFKQFYGSVSKADYLTMRHGFIQTHCRGNPKFNFHKYMIRALAADFKSVVGISWYLWIFVVIFLLLNVWGWHAYFWIAFIPLILLLAVGTKLEHVITQLAYEVAEKHIAIEGALVVQPSDDQFWFHRPRLILFLIHIILFQNSFQLAYFFWLWVRMDSKNCPLIDF